MKVRKAVIVAAGLGTRMLPASKVIPKEILPVVDKPAIQVVVEEAIASGIEEIILVLSPGRTMVREHFRRAEELERHLEQRGKTDLLDSIRTTNDPVRFTVAFQEQPLGLGHAVLQAREAVGDEPFAALLRVPRSEIPKYGIVSVRAAGEKLYELTGMVEKPAIEKAPSDFAILGRYVLTPDIFELLANGKPGVGGEIQLTDGLLALCQRRKLYGYEFAGTRYDLGDRLGFLTAQIGFGLKRPELADSLRGWLKSVL
jgi:UTP--glucose-1-phosphate uridylyltransferase